MQACVRALPLHAHAAVQAEAPRATPALASSPPSPPPPPLRSSIGISAAVQSRATPSCASTCASSGAMLASRETRPRQECSMPAAPALQGGRQGEPGSAQSGATMPCRSGLTSASCELHAPVMAVQARPQMLTPRQAGAAAWGRRWGPGACCRMSPVQRDGERGGIGFASAAPRPKSRVVGTALDTGT